MRVPKLLMDVAAWRWSPTLGLFVGSLAYVAFALVAIPDRIGGDGKADSSVGAFSALRARTSGRLEPSVSANVAEGEGDSDSRTAALRRQAPVSMSHTTAGSNNFPRRGFSPPLPRPEPETPPPPPPSIILPVPAPAPVAPPPVAAASVAAVSPVEAAAAPAPATTVPQRAAPGNTATDAVGAPAEQPSAAPAPAP